MTHGNKIWEITGQGNILIIAEIIGVLDKRHLTAAIILFRGEFPNMDGPHGWFHSRINNSEVVLRGDSFLTGRETMLTSYQNKEASKGKKRSSHLWSN